MPRLIARRAFALLSLLTLAAPAAFAQEKGKPVVVVSTSLGDFTVELEPDRAPKTVANFLSYVDKGFYDGTVFHRVIGPKPGRPGFMIQGGGMTPELKEKPADKPVQNESLDFNDNGMSNVRGTIAMARMNDPHSATSQFFVNLSDDCARLDRYRSQRQSRGGYAAFGRVIEGMDVVDKISKVETDENVLTDPDGRRNRAEDVPVTPVVIKSIKRKKA